MKILKSIGAVLAGFVTVFILSVVMDMIMEKTGVFPPPSAAGLFVTSMLVVAFIYRSIFTIIGGYVTATLAPRRPMKHVIILGIIGTVGGLVGVVVRWDLSSHWYPIALAVTGFPFIWLGGKLKTRKAGI